MAEEQEGGFVCCSSGVTYVKCGHSYQFEGMMPGMDSVGGFAALLHDVTENLCPMCRITKE
jgi:hypothetical protein